jgi:single-strand DNA-binding protein
VSGIHYLKSWLLKKPIQSPRSTDMSLYATGIIRIISDPALRSFDSGTMVANFAGGIMEGKDKQGNYINNAIDIEVWGKSAEVVVDRCKKGDCIIVSGNVKRQEWADKTTGDKRTKHVLSVQRFEFLPRTTPTEEPAF